jgi:hypothetical protein
MLQSLPLLPEDMDIGHQLTWMNCQGSIFFNKSYSLAHSGNSISYDIRLLSGLSYWGNNYKKIPLTLRVVKEKIASENMPGFQAQIDAF